jgi:DUF4097 and DUF4098 domain-containing protein YvlB
MKRIIKMSIAFMLLALTTKISAQEVLNVPLSNPGKPYKLKVNLVTGSINVTGTTSKDIEISADAGERTREREGVNEKIKEKLSDKEETGMRRISGTRGYEVTAKESNNTVNVHTDNPSRAVNLTIKVPQEGTLILETVNGGHIVVDNIKGELEVTNVNGSIRLNNISGSAVANTVNGNVVANFLSVTPNAAMGFSTLNGKIDVTYPSTIKANFKLKSDRGEVYSDFDMEIDKSQPKVNKTSDKGLYKINIDDWVYGKTNGGGPQIMMKSMMGNIYVRKK